MTQPFEFKNPLDGAPPPLADREGKNPFSDGEPVQAEISDNIYATSNADAADEQPEYVTTFTHHGPMLRRLAISSFVIVLSTIIACFVSGSGRSSVLLLLLVANGVLAVAIGIKAGYDMAAMRSAAMVGTGRGKTLAALVLSVVTAVLSVLAVVVFPFVQ